MEQYIPKSALLAKIERCIKYDEMVMDHDAQITELLSRELNTLYELSSFIKSLEAKEVDLNDYYNKFLEKEWFGNRHVRTVSEMMAFTAKHFFELGLKAQKGE